MLEMDWDIEKGWTSPEIHPYENLSLDPSCKVRVQHLDRTTCPLTFESVPIGSIQVFHYAIEIFEGMKAYRGVDNRIRLFRPELNMERMRRGAIRSALPDFDGTELLRCIKELVRSAGTLALSRLERSKEVAKNLPPKLHSGRLFEVLITNLTIFEFETLTDYARSRWVTYYGRLR